MASFRRAWCRGETPERPAIHRHVDAIEDAARRGGGRRPGSRAHDRVGTKSCAVGPEPFDNGMELRDVRRVVDQRQLLDRGVPPFDMLQRHEQFGVCAQRRRDGA
jgi:hypothetical protein